MRLDVSGEKLSGPRFWACEISEKSPVCVKLKNCELNITQCALASISKSEVAYKATKLGAAVRNRVNSYKAEDGNQHYFILCSLREGESMKLDATFFPDDKSVRFRAIGPNILHLSGVISPHKITVGSDSEEEEVDAGGVAEEDGEEEEEEEEEEETFWLLFDLPSLDFRVLQFLASCPLTPQILQIRVPVGAPLGLDIGSVQDGSSGSRWTEITWFV